MKKISKKLKLFPVVSLVLACAALAFAAGEKERMIGRAPQIRTLKTAGIIGEKADGQLGMVKSSPADKATVDAENADRQAVYTEIARGQSTSAALVAERRALQIVDQAAPGDWLQGADGKWYQKK